MRQRTYSDCDLEAMKTLLVDSFSKVNTAKNKEIVLFIGNIKAGKSTTINYLMGGKFEKVKYGAKEIAKPIKSVDGPNMGTYSAEADTLYSQVFDRDGFSYCDTPGFFENRHGIEKHVCSLMSMQAVINVAKNIKAVVVVIDVKSLLTQGASGLVDLMSVLKDLLVNPINASKSLFFLITQAGSLTKEDIKQEIDIINLAARNSLDSMAAEIQRILNNPEEFTGNLGEKFNLMEEAKKKIKILELMSNGNSILLPNIFDTGECRQTIIDAIRSSEPLQINAFNFLRFNQKYYTFKNVVRMISGQYAEKIRDMSQLEQVKLDCEEKIANYQAKIENNNKIKENFNLKEIGKNHEIVINNSEEAEKLKLELEKEKRDIELKVSRLEKILEELDSDEEQLCIDDKREEKRNTFAFLSYSAFRFTYNLGHPFEQVHIDPENKFKIHTCDAAAGMFDATYTSDFYQDGCAKVMIFAKRKYIPDTAMEIERIRNEIVILKNRLVVIEEKLTEQASIIANMKSLLDVLAKQGSLIGYCDETNSLLGVSLSEEIEKLKKNNVQLNDLKNFIHQNSILIQTLINITTIFQFQTMLTKNDEYSDKKRKHNDSSQEETEDTKRRRIAPQNQQGGVAMQVEEETFQQFSSPVSQPAASNAPQIQIQAVNQTPLQQGTNNSLK